MDIPANYRSAKAGPNPHPATSSFSSAGLPRPAANREAEEFYLQGRYYWEKRTPDSLNKAVDSFTQSLVHDPGYAPAYVGLADSYNLLREYTVMPASEAYPRALAAAKKAVELDPQSSEAHASFAFASFFGMWDAATAGREFQRALELNPSNAAAHHWYATYLECLRRYSESLAEIDRAQALEPASKSVLADKGSILFDAGRLADAIAVLNQMEENEPDFISPHRYLKFIYLQTADYPHYIEEARNEAVLMHDPPALAVLEATEKGFHAGGGKGLLNALLRQQTKLYERGQLSPYFPAETYSRQGNKQEALRYLKTAYDQHADNLVQIATNHAFDSCNSYWLQLACRLLRHKMAGYLPNYGKGATAPMSRYEELLEDFEAYSRSAGGEKSLMQHIAERLHEGMTRYNWVGFYLMEGSAFDALILGPYVGSFMPTLRIPLDRGLCGAAATTGQTVVVNNVAADPRYLGSDLVKSNMVAPIFVKSRVAAELCIESYFADTFPPPEQIFLESCAAIVGRFMEKNP